MQQRTLSLVGPGRAGTAIATALVGAKDALENIAEAMTLQNKILVKILAAISNQKCACPTCPPVA